MYWHPDPNPDHPDPDHPNPDHPDPDHPGGEEAGDEEDGETAAGKVQQRRPFPREVHHGYQQHQRRRNISLKYF